MSDYFDRVERQLVDSVDAGLRRSSRFPIRLEHVAPIAALLVVVVVAGVFLGTRGRAPVGSSLKGDGVRIVFTASALNRRSPAGPAIDGSIEILRLRLNSVFHDVQVSRAGNRIVVAVPDASSSSRARIVALAAPARLEFYDWEANVLTANGKTVASQLQTQDPAAVTISQGSGSAPPGDPGAGSMNLYDAVALASKQPAQASKDNAHNESQYYLFGKPGSAACATAARDQGKTAAPAVHCLLSGPDNNAQDLHHGVPPGVSAEQGQQIVVPPGIVVLQAADVSASRQTSFNDPSAQFFVLKDHVSLLGNDITNPQQSTDQAGVPDVTLSFTTKGNTEFSNVTSAIAHRGDLVSRLGQQLNQHFAVALDQKLITVPSIDFKTYPDGIQGGGGADITAGFTIQSAQDLATVLTFGSLSVNLKTH